MITDGRHGGSLGGFALSNRAHFNLCDKNQV